ncbi:MAG: acyl-CoA dehydrogenase, partial [Acidobacteria bacterium]|nr:acyl-CoA dehydrogenase [Acidobacteriota bacterium]
LASRSMYLSTVVLIPNSVGPGELLLEYGTAEQKRHYLPRLARGEEIPCFALTEPGAGSDAASLTSRGVVYRGPDGEPWLRLDWEKRYITLAPVATLIGLAVRLEDPEEILGLGPAPGISCVLVPAATPGIEIGDHHDPMGLPFPNGPITGRGVEVPVSSLIGGAEGAGRGWRMLMEALSGGRAISLPAQATAGIKWAARVTGAYASVRRQFGLPIRRFEGVEEPLARIAGSAYLAEAARVFTCGAVDAGERPSVISAVVKYNLTELARQNAADAVDVLGGAALCHGPHNLLADGYIAAPIGVTVEGANILTRTLITFGQGSLRGHPYLRRELDAVERGEPGALLRALAGHGLFLVRTLLRSTVGSWTRGRFLGSPVAGPLAGPARRLVWASARYALLTDLAVLGLGGSLKRRGKLTGRMADALSWIYLGLAVLRRFEAEGRRAEDLPLARWGLETALRRVQTAFEGVHRHLDVPLVGWWLRGPASWWLRLNPLGKGPSDALGSAAAAALIGPGRERLTAGLHLEGAGIERLEHAFTLLRRAEELGGAQPGARGKASQDGGEQDPVIAGAWREALASAAEACRVDVFSPDEYHGRSSPEKRPEK